MKPRREFWFYVYILSNHKRTCFYTGFTNDIIRRTIEHQNGFGSKFTNQYNLKSLLYWECYEYVYDAINREKEIKKWRRDKKLDLIKTTNPGFKDMSNDIFNDYGITKEEIDSHSKYLKDKYKK